MQCTAWQYWGTAHDQDPSVANCGCRLNGSASRLNCFEMVAEIHLFHVKRFIRLSSFQLCLYLENEMAYTYEGFVSFSDPNDPTVNKW